MFACAAVDYIWGYGTAYFEDSTITTTYKSYATAHSGVKIPRGGFFFNKCQFRPGIPTLSYLANGALSWSDADSAVKIAYLGRPYGDNALVIIMNSYIGPHINPEAWKIWSADKPNTEGTLFGEFNNTGPGASSAARPINVTLNAILLTSDQVQQYTLESVFGNPIWIDRSFNGKTPHQTPILGPEKTVTVGPNEQFTTIQAALNSLPADGSRATVEVLPGVYDEQVTISRTYTTLKKKEGTVGEVVVQSGVHHPSSASLNAATAVLTVSKNYSNVKVSLRWVHLSYFCVQI